MPERSLSFSKMLVIKNPLKVKKILTPVPPANKGQIRCMIKYLWGSRRGIPKWFSRTKIMDTALRPS
jgi:hypothetical protein